MDTEKKVQFVALTKEEIDAMIQQDGRAEKKREGEDRSSFA